MWRGLILLTTGLLLCGCAAVAPVTPSLGSMLGGRPPEDVHEQTSVNVSQDNFVLVKTNVCGLSKGFSLLGFITIYPATLGKAVNRLYGAAQLRPGEPQFVANLIIEHSSSFWILFGIPRTEVHADIVEFRPAPPASVRGKPK